MKRTQIFAASIALIATCLLLPSCATTTGSTANTGDTRGAESRVRATVTTWATAMQSQQVDAALACYSESFQHAEWGDKSGVRNAIEQARVIGYLNDIRIDTTAMLVSREQDYYIAGPVRMIGISGDDVLTFRLRAEGEVMRIVGSEQISVAKSQ